MHWDPNASVAANARALLPGQLEKYIRAGRKLDPARFHDFRLRTKRLRYTLEFFRPCYGPTLDQLIAALRQIQDDLGAISDCESAAELVDSKPFHRYLRARAKRKAAQFRLHWSEFLPDRWIVYLKRPR